jgi:hypothetical protein
MQCTIMYKYITHNIQDWINTNQNYLRPSIFLPDTYKFVSTVQLPIYRADTLPATFLPRHVSCFQERTAKGLTPLCPCWTNLVLHCFSSYNTVYNAHYNKRKDIHLCTSPHPHCNFINTNDTQQNRHFYSLQYHCTTQPPCCLTICICQRLIGWFRHADRQLSETVAEGERRGRETTCLRCRIGHRRRQAVLCPAWGLECRRRKLIICINKLDIND